MRGVANMRIKVTEDHIRRGVRGENTCCPIALAIQEATGNQEWHVGGLACWRTSNFDKNVELPIEATKFISRFDVNKSVQPFEFDIAIDEIEERI